MHVYKISNTVNDKSYVGKDSSMNSHRWYYHRWAFDNPSAHDYQKILYRAMRKYGLEKFEYTVLEECLNPDDLRVREEYWIDKLGTTNPSKGYNISSLSGPAPYSSKTYLAKSPSGAVYTVDVVSLFCSEHHILPKRFYSVTSGNKRQYKGWQFVEQGNDFPDLNAKRRSSPRKGMVHTKKREANSKTCTWKLIDVTGNTIEIENLKSFCESNDLHYRSMLRVASGDRAHHKGWTVLNNGRVQRK